MIDAYHFGSMTIKGKTYTHDTLIYPNGTVASPWIREAGHTLSRSDIEQLLSENPKQLVIGTGASGCMHPASGFVRTLEAQGIEVILQPTQEAVDTYNALHSSSASIAACFHLTC